ncbi:MAG: hypothetical protein ACOY0T_19550 [Myxococcota bacterium]
MQSLRERWQYRIEAELTVAVPESEALLLASETIEATLSGLVPDAPEERLREAASVLRSSVLQVATNALRIAAAAECLLLIADVVRAEGRGE